MGQTHPLDSHCLLVAPWHAAFYLHSEADKLGMEMPSGLHGSYTHTCCHQNKWQSFHFLDMEQKLMRLKGGLKTRQKHKCFSEAGPELGCPCKTCNKYKICFL